MVFHVLNRGIARMQLFAKVGDYEAFDRVLADTLRQAPMRLCGYCVMPNHWHLLLWPVEMPEDWVERVNQPENEKELEAPCVAVCSVVGRTVRPSGRRRSPCFWGVVEFADRNELEIVLLYYPPYHSRYNPIERCWGILEMHWNGTLLDTVDTVLQWARTMTWKAIQPAVHLLEKVYEKGVRVAKKAFKKIEDRLERDQSLPKYCVRIQPHGG